MELPTLHAAMAIGKKGIAEGKHFWTAYKPWLLNHGYTIYDFCEDDDRLQLSSSLQFYQSRHPFATFSPELPCEGEFFRYQSFVVAARDEKHREVSIKIASNNGPEIAVNRLLMGFSELYEVDNFPSVLPPLRILPSPHDFSFIITPRWGHVPMQSYSLCWDINPLRFSRLPSYPFKTVEQVLYLVSSLLKGLAFLHSHKVVHRDLHDGNLLVNVFSHDPSHCVEHFQNHLGGGLGLPVCYAIFDFNLSLAFPKDMPIDQCRLKCECDSVNLSGSTLVMQGELDYDPFAFDVECMGYLLLRQVYSLIPHVPLLAPLLDRMLTHVVTSRFTAAEAFQFCEFIRSSLPRAILDRAPPLTNTWDPRSVPWEKLDPDFVKKWSTHRAPPVRISTRFLRWLSSFDVGKTAIQTIRRWVGLVLN